MKMLHPNPPHDLTYNDVFMVPSLSDVGSRFNRKESDAFYTKCDRDKQ